MKKLEQIKIQLKNLAGSSFQRLCDDWLHKKGYKYINSIGMMAIENRTTTGTPDSLNKAPGEKYIFAEYSIQIKSLANKFEDDINKCLSPEKTGIPISEIWKIIICYIGNLSTKEIANLNSICAKNEVLLEVCGLDAISLSIKNDYPILSEDYLGLSLDTGQLLPIDAFINRYGKNKFTTPIDNKILFQDEAQEEAILKLKSSNFLLVSGAAGVGKTLFVVNFLKKLQLKNKKLKILCLFDKGVDFTKDMAASLSEPGDYIIFIDDANRFDNRLDYILHYLHEDNADRQIRIIATVRDYARSLVIEKASKFTTPDKQIISPLSSDQIVTLISTLYNIKNPEYQRRITEIANGNPRLAVMASSIAVDTSSLGSLYDAAEIYNKYYGENNNVKSIIANSKLMKTACIISFFRMVDASNDNQMTSIEKIFGLTTDDFWESVKILHQYELVDLYEDQIAKISDQVLSTYLFYITVFKNRILRFSVLVKNFYPELCSNIIDSIQPVINSFDSVLIISNIRNEIKDIYQEISENHRPSYIISFLKTFWYALPTEALKYSNKYIGLISDVKINWEKEKFSESKESFQEGSIVDLLSSFRSYKKEEFRLSFDLLLKYLERNKNALGGVIARLFNHYNFKHNDIRNDFYIQNHVINQLIVKSESGKNYLFSRLFILISNKFLKVKFTQHDWCKGEAIQVITFNLSPNPTLNILRKNIIKNLSNLLLLDEYKSHVLKVFEKYVNRVVLEGKELVESDLLSFRECFISKLNQDDILHCLIMQDYYRHLEFQEIDFPSEWPRKFSNDILILSNLLLPNRKENRFLNIGYEKYQQYFTECVAKHVEKFNLEQFDDFMKKCERLNNALMIKDGNDSLREGVETSLLLLFKTNQSSFSDYLDVYYEYDHIFEIRPGGVVNELFSLYGSKDVWHILHKKDYKSKNLWISAYFSQLPEECVTQESINDLLIHINKSKSNELFSHLGFLDKYQKIDAEIYPKIVRVLVDKSKYDANYARLFAYFFNRQSSLFGKWFDVFNSNESLIYNSYLALSAVDTYSDYAGDALKLLIERRFDFIFKIINHAFMEENRFTSVYKKGVLNFLWDRDSYIKDINSYGRYFHQKAKESGFYTEHVFSDLFIKHKGQPDSEALFEKKFNFLQYSIETYCADIDYICFIFESIKSLEEYIKIQLFILYLDCNSNFENFKRLICELTVRSWSGSCVPMLEKERKFLESLLPVFNSIKFLDHRSYVEEKIEHIVKDIEYEKKRDFIGYR